MIDAYYWDGYDLNKILADLRREILASHWREAVNKDGSVVPVESFIYRHACTDGDLLGVPNRDGAEPLDPVKYATVIAIIGTIHPMHRVAIALAWEKKVVRRNAELGYDPRTPADHRHHAALERRNQQFLSLMASKELERRDVAIRRVFVAASRHQGRTRRRSGVGRATARTTASRGSPARSGDDDLPRLGSARAALRAVIDGTALGTIGTSGGGRVVGPVAAP
jgi:hypothetical protein